MTHPSDSIPVPVRPTNPARKDYAVAIFNWCRAHPTSSIEDFLAMIDRAEAWAANERRAWQ